jgi:hypothetical protein
MSHRQLDREQVLRPLRRALTGEPVPHAELVRAGRMVAETLVKHGRTLSITSDGPWAGVWNLDRLSDDEAAAWGMWVATKVRRI